MSKRKIDLIYSQNLVPNNNFDSQPQEMLGSFYGHVFAAQTYEDVPETALELYNQLQDQYFDVGNNEAQPNIEDSTQQNNQPKDIENIPNTTVFEPISKMETDKKVRQ